MRGARSDFEYSTLVDTLSVDSRLAVSNVALHLVNVDLAHRLILARAVHVDVHDVVGDSLW